MADINSLFGGGGQTLNTNGGIAGLGGGGGDADFFKAMAMRKMQQAEQDRQRRQEREDQAFAMAKQAAQNANRPPEISDQDQRIKDMQERDMKIQMQARQGKAPTRRITGSNIIAGDVLDPLAMNAYQRELFLPKNSQMQGDINDSALRGIGFGSTNPNGYNSSGPEKIAQQSHQPNANAPGVAGNKDLYTGGGANNSGRADWYGLQTKAPRPEDDEQQKRAR